MMRKEQNNTYLSTLSIMQTQIFLFVASLSNFANYTLHLHVLVTIFKLSVVILKFQFEKKSQETMRQFCNIENIWFCLIVQCKDISPV